MSTGFSIGNFFVHYYGVLIAVGALAAIWLSSREAKRLGKNPEFLLDAFFWVALAGVVGARIWHIFTPPASMVAQGITTKYYLTHFYDAIAIWNGGLGIFGAVIGGGLALFFYTKFKGENFLVWADIIAPGLALAQAIGRWGNYVNQEVYGLPSNLPWAIFIDKAHRLTEYQTYTHYHPLFLYESLWCLVTMGILLWIGHRRGKDIQAGNLFLTYLIFYAAGRFGLEFLRLDVSAVGGVNANQTFMLAVSTLSGMALLRRGRTRGEPEELPQD